MSSDIYQPPGPVSEALASYYVRHIVQREIDRAFTLADPGDRDSARAQAAATARR